MNSSAAERVHGPSLSFIQWRIQGGDPGGAGHPLFLDQTEAPKGRKIFFGDWLPPTPSKGLEDLEPPPPYYLKVWIWNCYAPINVNPVGGGGKCGQGVGI